MLNTTCILREYIIGIMIENIADNSNTIFLYTHAKSDM
jgi:hypothetical protein